jgi:hypothetical protein
LCLPSAARESSIRETRLLEIRMDTSRPVE